MPGVEPQCVTEGNERQRHREPDGDGDGGSGGRAVGGHAAGFEARVLLRLPIIGERQPDGFRGGGPAAGRVGLGNIDLGCLVSGADDGEGPALELAVSTTLED